MKLSEELEKLNELKEKGVLTEEEFTQVKQKLIEICDEEEAIEEQKKQLLFG